MTRSTSPITTKAATPRTQMTTGEQKQIDNQLDSFAQIQPPSFGTVEGRCPPIVFASPIVALVLTTSPFMRFTGRAFALAIKPPSISQISFDGQFAVTELLDKVSPPAALGGADRDPRRRSLRGTGCVRIRYASFNPNMSCSLFC
jgi:hypothetical protein